MHKLLNKHRSTPIWWLREGSSFDMVVGEWRISDLVVGGKEELRCSLYLRYKGENGGEKRKTMKTEAAAW